MSIEHKRYCVVYDIGHTCDGIECDTMEEAEAMIEDLYRGWMADAISEMMVDGECRPTPEQIEDWDDMIDLCTCMVVEWNDTICEYDDTYFGIGLDDDKLMEIGWMPWYELNND